MTTFNVPTQKEVSASSQTAFDTLQKGLGMVPNLYAAIAYSENGLSRYLAFQTAKTSLSNKEKEAVNLIVSQINQCRYCQSAHIVLGKMNGFSEEEVIQIRKGSSSDKKLDALVRLAGEITVNRGKVAEATLEKFFAAGYDKGNLVDVILAIADKIAMNYLHNITEVPIDFPVATELVETFA